MNVTKVFCAENVQEQLVAHGIETLSVFFQQLKGSRNIILVPLLVLVASVAGYFTTGIWYFLYVILASGYIVLFLATMAMVTALHESEHVSKLHEIGSTQVTLTAHRIGDVSFRVENPDNLTPEQRYQVAIAPYVKTTPYLTEVFFLILLTLISWYSPFLLNILLFVLTALFALHLLATVCSYIVIKTKRQAGFCVSFSRALTSRGDMEDIASWNNKQQTQS
jgi:hypothetical protein